MGRKVVAAGKSIVYPGDAEENLYPPTNETPCTQQQSYQAASSARSERASGAAEVLVADEASTGSFALSVEGDAPGSEISGDIFVQPHAADNQHSPACSASDSLEEIASGLSVEEKQPLNARAAQTRSRTLHHTSEEVLHTYQCLKRAVQQRIYRRYYVKWVQLLTQRPSRAMATQTPGNDSLCAPVVEGAQLLGEVEVAAADFAATSLLYSAAQYGSQCNAAEDAGSEFTHGGLREGQQGLSASSSASVVCLCDPAVLPTKPSAPLMLRSRSTPSLLRDYGRHSSPPRRVLPQLYSLPSAKPPSLVNLGCPITVCQPKEYDKTTRAVQRTR
ncbi:uncharacterized protein Tco025E_00418 [Trypanosoma conorhini]|uniref:Uncharacterized protein n=1 Tax=Trypanosoma conorhini TaxID=83891 RepID=A0A3R7NUP9_9TRYP|nr:uncharacterized protein Tco025E_00418 [Trypanosoma conorhini]RNF27348.1 hypothetical protein Tco025E_00418 [Trypanosoma conorhini]